MAIAGPSSEPVSLPLLPHPELFIRPSAFTTHILNEAIRGLRSLDQLKEDVVTGRFNARLDTPKSSDLPGPPLVAVYRQQTFHIPAPPPRPPRPSVRPQIPPTSPFSRCRTLKSCLAAYTKLTGKDVMLQHQGSAVCLSLRPTAGCAWIKIKLDAEANIPQVTFVRLYKQSWSKGQSPPRISEQPPRGSLRTISAHLTRLQLSLPELLYRLIGLPSALEQPCYFCKRYLPDTANHHAVLQDAVEEPTGWVPDALPDPQSRRVSASHARPEENDPVGAGGRWVWWHPLCEPPAFDN